MHHERLRRPTSKETQKKKKILMLLLALFSVGKQTRKKEKEYAVKAE
jgi:hypothetical protein